MYIQDMKIVKNNVKLESLVQIYVPKKECTTIIFGTITFYFLIVAEQVLLKAPALCGLTI